MLKTVEMIVDFRRNPPALPPLTIMNSTVTAVVMQTPGHRNFSGPEVGQSDLFLLFCTLPICIFAYYYCPVAVILLHCRASVTITNSSYV